MIGMNAPTSAGSPSPPDEEPGRQPERSGRTGGLRRGTTAWLTAHWWTGVGGVVGVLGLFVGVLAWLAPAGDDEAPAAGKADHQGQERWSSVKSLGNAPLDLDPVPPTTDTDRASGDIWVDTTEALTTDSVLVSPSELSGVRKWRLTDAPSLDSCRSELRRPGEDEVSVKYGHFFCVRTSEDRVAVIAVDSVYQDDSGAAGAQLAITVYEK